jgi:hypothetical protein
MRSHLSFLAVLLLATAATLSAQDLQRPAGWIVKADDSVADGELRPDSIRFLVNEQQLAVYARESYMDYDGNVGLRVGRDVNLHVTRLDVTPLAEPDAD